MGTQHDEVPPIRHEQHGAGGAFLIERGGARLAEMTWRRGDDGVAVVDHTWVDDALRGHGVAQRLVEAAVAWARETGTRIVPTCSYARAVFQRHAEFSDVLA